MKVLVTGAAGFIGSHLCRALLEQGDEVVGLDNLNDYYDISLKWGRLEVLLGIPQIALEEGRLVTSDCYKQFRFIKLDLVDREALSNLFAQESFDRVCNLAAQAGVRYSIKNPQAYTDSNLVGFVNLLECVRHYGVTRFVFASSSSVYGHSAHIPFNEEDRTDTPVSLYAATKKSNEVMAHAYAYLYNLSITGLRYFSVYGPWGRPDMAPSLFVESIDRGEPIKVFNDGNLSRDFTYIDDVVAGTVAVLARTPDKAGVYGIYNIGCGHPVALMDFIRAIENELGKKAVMQMCPMQRGDVYRTYADTTKLQQEVGYKPTISLQEGISRFVSWYKFYSRAEKE